MSLRELYRSLSSLTPEQRALFARRLEESGWGRQAMEIVPRPPGGGPVPVSLMQQRLWVLDQMEPGNPFYNLPLLCFDLFGPLQAAVLERCFQEIERRHEGLRTVFSEAEDGSPLQQVLPAAGAPLPVIDLSRLPESCRADVTAGLARDEARRLFDLASGPLWRLSLLRFSPERHLLLVAMHHIVSDAWSIGVLHRELTALYPAFLRGLPSPLPELPIQYPDFALWQRQRLQGELLEEELRFWKEQLAGAPDRMELPIDRPRPPVRGYAGRRLTAEPSAELPEAVARLARESGASLYMLLLAAFNALLHRHTGQRDLIFAAPVAGRNNAGTEGLIGFFVNTVVLRNDLRGDPTFRELTARVKNVVLDVFEHQELPFDKLVEAVRPHRDTSFGPIYQAMFSLQNTPTPDLELEGIRVHLEGVDSGTAQTDLILFVDTQRGLLDVMQLEYNTDLFEEVTVRRLLNHLVALLTAVAADPALRLSDLPLLAAAERHQLLLEWSGGATAEMPEETLPVLLAAQAARTPEETAVIFGDTRWTYRELHQRASRLARTLRSLGVGPEIPVAVCAERSFSLITGLLGVLHAGGAYVPLDPSYPRERLGFMLEESGAPVLLVQGSLRQIFDGRTARPGLQTIDLDPFAAGPVDEDALPPPPGLLPEHPAYVIYTSGSTGKPKGAVNTHRAVVNRLLWMRDAYGLTAADRVLQKTPFSFDVSVWELFLPLLTGARLVFAEPGGHRDDAYLRRRIHGQGITTAHFVPSMLREFLEGCAPGQLSSLRRVFSSGEALPAELRDRFFERLPGTELHNLYGPTEAAVDVTAWDCAQPATAQPGVPIGRPIANVRILLLDAAGNPVPPGAAGELHIGGVALARGYLGRPDLTAASFVPAPFGERLYRTGDLARYLPGGAIEFLGRIDHQIKLRGVRIELGDIEAALHQHPAVREGAVALRERSAGNPVLAAFYTIGDAAPDVIELRAFLQARLPDAMVPAAYYPLESLPRTPSGKLDRKALPALERGDLHGPSGDSYLAPRTPLEESLAEMWTELLGLERIGIEDDFFELGGHSLLAIRLVSRLRHRLERELSAQLVFQHPTIAGLAGALENLTGRERAAAPALVATPRTARRVRSARG